MRAVFFYFARRNPVQMICSIVATRTILPSWAKAECRAAFCESPWRLVSGLKADAADIAGQAVRILRHDLHGICAVGLVDAHRTRRANTMVVKEHHDFANDLLLDPCSGNAAGSYRTYA